jgi:hypothetical protein
MRAKADVRINAAHPDIVRAGPIASELEMVYNVWRYSAFVALFCGFSQKRCSRMILSRLLISLISDWIPLQISHCGRRYARTGICPATASKYD